MAERNREISDVRVKRMLKREVENCRILIDRKISIAIQACFNNVSSIIRPIVSFLKSG